MAIVFGDLAATTRRQAGVLAVGVLLMKELRGLVKFALRERLSGRRATESGRPPRRDRGGWDFASELRWAWRSVIARGARAVLIVLLIALAVTANVLIFAVADSVVFNRVPYPRAHEILEIQSSRFPGRPGDNFLTAALLDEWRAQTDLFSSVQAYLTKNVFVVADGRSEIVPTADVTPGLIELLGMRPKWGRSLVPADAAETAAIPALISERLARERFGVPPAAVGRTLETTSQPLLVVGVMPDEFLFPTGSYQIWRALDPRGPLARGFVGVQSIARMSPGISMEALTAQMNTRGAAIGAAAGARAGYSAAPGPFYMAAMTGAEVRTMFMVLLGGALCLLLTACANVASLELAGALRRARTFAVQMALGASRATLARVALLEGALLVVAAVAVGSGLAWLALDLLKTYLPSTMLWRTVNPIDLDARALLFMAAVAGAAWLLAALPTVVYASRAGLLDLLKTEERTTAASRGGAFVRRALTVLEVAIAVILVVGATMYTRSYLALLRVDKGFDSSNLVQVSFTIPVEYYAGPGEYPALSEAVLTQVRSLPGVVGAVAASAPPSMGNSPWGDVKMEVDGRRFSDETFVIGDSPVSPSYFGVVGLPLRQGRWFVENEPATNAIVTERFAQRFWPDGNVVGRSFRRVSEGGRETPWNHVVGVVGDFRTTRPGGPHDRGFYYYTPRQPPPPPAPVPAKPRPISTGGSWRFLNVMVRLDSSERAAALLDAARTVDRRLRVTLESVDEKYAAMFSDVLLATRVTNAFGAIAFLVAVVGVYGVMAYLVIGRRREIGIRMALGADRRDIRRLVMRSAGTLVVVGTAVGLAGAALASRWAASQFFGVSTVDPVTYLAVAAAILVTALLATWQPARQAAGIDPALTLKGE